MQARLTYIGLPLSLVALFFALAAALLLGGVLGYELKPAIVTAGAPRIVVLQPGPVPPPACVWVDSRKGC